MTSFTAAAATMQQLSQVAMEEASRLGLHEGDLELLFAALAVNDQAAGRALRSIGITLDRVRAANDAMHAAHLARLGVSVDTLNPRRTVFRDTGEFTWAPRTVNVIEAAGDESRGYAEAVLRALLAEPSGQIDDLLKRLDTSAGEIRVALAAEAARLDVDSKADNGTSGRNDTVVEVFVPAPAEAVWGLLADPARLHEWHPFAGAVDAASEASHSTATGDVWTVLAPASNPDGTPIRGEAKRRRQMEIMEVEPPHLIGWRTTRPDQKPHGATLLRVEISPAPGGCQVRATWTRTPGSRWHSVATWPVRPLRRFQRWITLTQMTAAISRAFR